MREKSHGELLAELLDIPENVFAGLPLREIMTAPKAIQGLEEKDVEKINILKELSRRWFSDQNRLRLIKGPEDVARHLIAKIKGDNREHFMMIAMNTLPSYRNVYYIGGGLSEAIVHPREVFRAAMWHSASSIIVAHNHPSGRPAPSKEDILVTERLIQCGKIMEIPVLDHVILGNNVFYSYKENKVKRIRY